MIEWLSHLGPIWALLSTVGLILWCGGVLCQMVLGGTLDPDVTRLEQSLRDLERLSSAVVVPGMVLLPIAVVGRLLGAGALFADPSGGQALVLVMLALGASASASHLLRRALSRMEQRREDLSWERDVARTLAIWRLASATALAALTAILMLASIRA